MAIRADKQLPSSIFIDGNLREQEGFTRFLLITSIVLTVISSLGFFVGYGLSVGQSSINSLARGFAIAAICGSIGIVLSLILTSLLKEENKQCSRKTLYKELIKKLDSERVKEAVLDEWTAMRVLKLFLRAALFITVAVSLIYFLKTDGILHERWKWALIGASASFTLSIILPFFLINERLSEEEANRLSKELGFGKAKPKVDKKPKVDEKPKEKIRTPEERGKLISNTNTYKDKKPEAVLATVVSLLKEGPIPKEDLRFAIRRAADHSHVEAMEVLLRHGADSLSDEDTRYIKGIAAMKPEIATLWSKCEQQVTAVDETLRDLQDCGLLSDQDVRDIENGAFRESKKEDERSITAFLNEGN